MKKLSATISILMALSVIVSIAPISLGAEKYDNAHTIVLSSTEGADGSFSHSATLDGAQVKEYDYVWHADPSVAHDEVKNAPAEYYTGTKPQGDAVYIAHDIFYFPQLDINGFKRQNYDGEQEWCYYYTCPEYSKYIFATLPVEGASVPTDMMHSEKEAYSNAVLHITEAGTYILKGNWHGQIWIDLGDSDDVFADKSKKVTIILDGVDVTCTVAPALVFYSVYECDNTWEDRSSYSKTVDLTDAGARVIIADGTTNNFSGTNVFRMLKTKLKDENDTSAIPVQKKQRKTDGAFYSYMSMTISGESRGDGVLNITSGFEGLDSELHLGINSGNINIFSDNDGINVNEDGVSVVQINGGEVHILAGLGAEGDGIDSNGYLVVNGGTVISMANPRSDSGMDSDRGSYINGGTVASFGSTMDWAKADDDNASTQATMNLRFSTSQSADEAVIITDTEGKVVFAYDPDKDDVAGAKIRSYQGAVISCPSLQVGKSYNVYVGGNLTGAEINGVYIAETVTDFKGSQKQCYTGNTVGGHGGFSGIGSFFGDGTRPDKNQQGAQMPDDLPSGAPQPPNGNIPQMPDGMTPPDMQGATRPNGNQSARPDMQGGQTGFANCTSPTVFSLSEKVNAFSGVTDSGSHILSKSGQVYTCSICQKTFSDDKGENEIAGNPPPVQDTDTPEEHKTTSQDSKTYSLAVVIIDSLISFAVGAGVGVLVILLIKNKKS